MPNCGSEREGNHGSNTFLRGAALGASGGTGRRIVGVGSIGGSGVVWAYSERPKKLAGKWVGPPGRELQIQMRVSLSFGEAAWLNCRVRMGM